MPITLNGSGPIAGATTVNGLTLPTDSIQPGMVLINTTTFNAVSSVSVNNCFTSTYDNYRILTRLTAASGNPTLTMRLRLSGTDASGGDYVKQDVSGFGGTAGAGLGTGQTSWHLGDSASANANRWMQSVELMGPNMALNTLATANGGFVNSTPTTFTAQASYNHSLTTQYDGLSLISSTGTISGYIRVYGYRNS